MTAILVIPAVAVAKETSGRYATHDGTSSVQEMPDGSKVQIDHYSQISFAADQRHPLDNMSADCMGRSQIFAVPGQPGVFAEAVQVAPAP